MRQTDPNDPKNWAGTYVTFSYVGPTTSGKTHIWDILTDNEAQTTIGQVKWYAPWRKYSFFPSGNTVYEHVCLTEIAAFLNIAGAMKFPSVKEALARGGLEALDEVME